jgi:hypothetical protein
MRLFQNMFGWIREASVGRWAGLFCGAVLLWLAGCATAPRNSAASQERAAYVCSFGEFVEWPGDVFAGTNAPFVIGIYGADTLGGKLQGIANGKRINGRKVVIQPIKAEVEMNQCQILFISDIKQSSLSAIATRLTNASVLTVSEDVKHFDESGLMVNLFESGGKTVFEINDAAAGRARLKISAKLLALARRIQK